MTIRTQALIGTVLAPLIALPLFASAQTVDELRAQVLELLQRVQVLQQQTGAGAPVSGGYSTAPATPVSGAPLQCPHISRSLKLGSSGDDVSRLQRFLALDPAIYPEAQVTGYYGSLTEAAVKRFQCKNKIVCEGTAEGNGYGVTGPRTAAILALQCPDAAGNTGGGTVGGFIRVTPVSGVAPLAVSIQTTVNTTNSCTGATYVLNYGDGTPVVQIPVPSGSCQPLVQTYNHVYPASGIYTIMLSAGVHSTSATVNVAAGVPQSPQGTVDSFSASPTSGSVPLTVRFSGVANGAGSCGAGSYTLAFGDGQSASIPLSSCAPISYNVDHIYSSSGNYTATLYPRSSASGSSVGSVSIATSGGSSGGGAYSGTFSIAPSASGDALSVQVTFDIETSCAAYDLDWGDGSGHVTQSQGSCSGGGAVQKQFTHQYPNSGSYTVTLKRGSGLSDVDVAAVSVSN